MSAAATQQPETGTPPPPRPLIDRLDLIGLSELEPVVLASLATRAPLFNFSAD